MNLNKKAFTLVEIIVSISIMSLISIFAMGFYRDIFHTNKQSYNKELAKLQIINTKLFLERNNNIDKIRFEKDILYFEENVLLKDISKYSINSFQNYHNINICIKNIICQDLVINK